MIFLVEYDRAMGVLTSLKTYADAQRREAAEARLVLELRLNRDGIDREVVILDAVDEAALRKTHRRYFETLNELASQTVS